MVIEDKRALVREALKRNIRPCINSLRRWGPEPDDFMRAMVVCYSWDLRGISRATSRRYMRELVRSGYLTEDKRCSTACRWRPSRTEADAICREVISEGPGHGDE